MKVKNSPLIVGILALSLTVVSGYAQTSQPSSKVTAKTANLTLLPETSAGMPADETSIDSSAVALAKFRSAVAVEFQTGDAGALRRAISTPFKYATKPSS